MSESTPANAKDASRAVEAARESLGETLDAIEDKFNVKKRTSEWSEKAKRSYETNPTPWIVGATATIIAVGGLVAWAIFGDD
ncbi:DUF3618 domain-containing protein [Salinibacterium sp. dk2585]|uniref:DUF3618 domain-containing protein n=1 Tax=unclassified Salinibacterium TaxID=2632331 RepID=UPI0011C24836|nr:MULTISPECIES: DUF3618 domain-containing protein [unclassified Salinibacterium]QEE62433.1 DUF3618 domain-containing protein [Salinibacterium sp. dk2585]TXK52684.1 DUF3618 domain-containing protein [Salinibacterium sp. dk5596]